MSKVPISYGYFHSRSCSISQARKHIGAPPLGASSFGLMKERVQIAACVAEHLLED